MDTKYSGLEYHMELESYEIRSSFVHVPCQYRKKSVARDSDQITWLHRRASSVNTRTIKFQNCVQYLDRNHIFYL